MIQTIVWQRLDRTALEFLQWTNEPAVVLHGEVVGDINGVLGRVRYRVAVEEGPFSQVALLQFWSDAGNRQLHLSRSRQGQWLVNGIMRPDLATATDVDIGVTPATNILPLRRFRLEVGESCDLVAVWIQFPALSVKLARQRYTRIADDRYWYESVDSGFLAELTVGDDGMVVQYADLWRMLTVTENGQ